MFSKATQVLVFIFNTDVEKEIPVTVRAGRDNLEASVELCGPNNWNIYPKSHPINLANKGAETTVVFKVIPPKNEYITTIEVIIAIDKVLSKPKILLLG